MFLRNNSTLAKESIYSNTFLNKWDEQLTNEYYKNLSNWHTAYNNPDLNGIAYIKDELNRYYQTVTDFKAEHYAFIQAYSKTTETENQQRFILDYAEKLGATAAELAEDRKAFSRWFGMDAVIERYRTKLSKIEFKIYFLLRKLTTLFDKYFKDKPTDSFKTIWQDLNLENFYGQYCTYEGDSRIRSQTIKTLNQIGKHVPANNFKEFLSENIVQYIHRAALEPTQNCWVQCEAIQLLLLLDKDTFFTILDKRFQNPKEDYDFFVRRHIVDLLCQQSDTKTLEKYFPLIKKDSSAFVKQGLIHCFSKETVNNNNLLFKDILNDTDPQVRAKAILHISEIETDFKPDSPLLVMLTDAIKQEKDEFVLRVAFETLFHILKNSNEKSTEKGRNLYKNLLNSLQEQRLNNNSIVIRRAAAKTMEKLWLVMQNNGLDVLHTLEKSVRNLKEGDYIGIKKGILGNAENEIILRALSVIAQNDFGFQVELRQNKIVIIRGQTFIFKLRRFFYEMFHPDPGKRQGISHTIGRNYEEVIHVPSEILAELTQTKVLGEPLYIHNEGGWRPYLPLVDEVLSCYEGIFFFPKTVTIVTSEGFTEIIPPKLSVPFLSFFRLNLQYDTLTRLRNYQEEDNFRPNQYITALRNLGFKVELKPHQYIPSQNFPSDSTVLRFFYANGD